MEWFKTINEIVVALSNYAWPATFVGLALWFKGPIRELFGVLKQQIQMGATVKYGALELNGIKLDAGPAIDGGVFEIVGADEELFKSRDDIYRKQKNIFLVHRALKTTQFHERNGLPIYDVSIYLICHKNYGALNEIRYVEYYLGKHFRTPLSRYGSKFIVKNSKDGFAVRTTMYGPGLCDARIYFHDGSTAVLNRYMDFEGSGYRFDPNNDGNVAEAQRR
jgi:hypothetical protein